MRSTPWIRGTAFGLVVLLGAAACGSAVVTSPGPSPAPSTAPSIIAGGPGNLSTAEIEAGAPAVDQSYADLLLELRTRAGLIDALGAAGPSVYAFIDASESAFLAAFAKRSFPDAELANEIASISGDARSDRPAPAAAIPVFFTTWMLATMFGTFPAHDDGHGSIAGSISSDKQRFTSTEDGITTTTDLTTDISDPSFDGNNRRVTLTVTHDTTVTDADGKVVSHLAGSITVTVEFQGCPAADGLIVGMVRFVIQEGSPDAVAGGAYAKTTTEQNVQMYVGNDAWLTRQDSEITNEISIRGGIRTAGQAPEVANDWDAKVEQSNSFVAKAPPTSSSYTPDWKVDPTKPGQFQNSSDFRVVADRAVADKTIVDTVKGSAFVTGFPMLYITESAQKYWRNGNCVEVAVVQGNGGDVQPDQEVEIVAQPRHKIDHVDLAKPVVAAFSGVAAVSPVGVGVAAPASFTYMAGHDQYDIGTVSLTSTSNRGIGTTDVRFRVPELATPTPTEPPTDKPARPTPTPPPAGLRGTIIYHYESHHLSNPGEGVVYDLTMDLTLRDTEGSAAADGVVEQAGPGSFHLSYRATRPCGDGTAATNEHTDNGVVDVAPSGAGVANDGLNLDRLTSAELVIPATHTCFGADPADNALTLSIGDLVRQCAPIWGSYPNPPLTGETNGIRGVAETRAGVFGYRFDCSDTGGDADFPVAVTVEGFLASTK